MLPKQYYKTATIAASVKTLKGFMELNAEAVEGLATMQIILKNHDTPIDAQIFSELESLYSAAHRMLSAELAKVEHIRAMQKAQAGAQKHFDELEAKHNQKSNQATVVTA